MAKKRILFSLSLVLCFGIIVNSPVYSSQIKRVQEAVVHLTEDDTTRTCSLSNPVNTHNSFVIQSTQGGLFTAFLRDEQALDISQKPGDDSCVLTAASVGTYVVEYREGIKVFKGITAIGPKVYTKDILLPQSIDIQKSFPLISVRGDINKSNKTQTLFFTATFPDQNTLRLKRLDLPLAVASSELYVAWQVIEIHTDVKVRSGTVSISYDASRVMVDLSSDPIHDINKAFLVFNYTAGAGINGLPGLLMTRGTITDVNTLSFNRAAIGSKTDQNIDVAWYVVELTDSASNVRKANTAMPAGSSSINVILNPPVDTTRAFPIISVSGGDITTAMLSDDLVRAEITETVTLGDTLALTRQTQTAATEVDWFVVELAPLTIKTPDGKEVWQVGEVENLLWSYASSLETEGSSPSGHHLLDILLSQDGGFSFPFTIAQGVDATSGFYAWTIPPMLQGVNLIGDKLRLRLIDTDLNTHNYDDSNSNFKIQGLIDLAVPIAGEVWYTGDTHREIVWHKKGDLGYSNFVIRLSENSGLTYDTVVADGLTQESVCVGNRCSWFWSPEVADKIGSDRRIKVYLASDPENVYDTSDGDFYIKGKLQITSPNGGEEWETQTTQKITWKKWGSFNQVSVYYSEDGGDSFDYITARAIPAGDTYGSYDWDIPVEIATDFARIKIASQQAEDIQVEDVSDGDFRIVRPVLKVTYPDRADEVWYVGDEQTITWEVDGAVQRVHCWYVKAGKDPVRITPRGGIEADQGEGKGSFTWSDIPGEVVSDDVRIMVAKVDGNRIPGKLHDYSDNPFSIKGKLRIVSPNGGEVYIVDSSESIRWDAQGSMGRVRIKFAGNGVDFNTVISPEPEGIPAARKKYFWDSIPDVLTNRGKIRLELILDPVGVFDDSDDYFSIKGLLSLTAPQGGETFYIDETIDISWKTVGTVGDVVLYYSLDGGATYPDSGIIASGISQEAVPFVWTIPDKISSWVRVKVAAVGDETTFDSSERDFAIKGKLYLIAPNGGEKWQAGTQEEIVWKRLGRDMGEVKLEYSLNKGADGYPNLIATDIASGDLTYSWQIPEVVGSQLKVKITVLDDAQTSDTSDNAFTIKGRFVLLIPEGGEIWQVGTRENISWVTYGTIDKVNLYYSTDGGLTYPLVIAQGISNVDGYLHTVPDVAARKIRVKVESYYDSSVYATSTGDSIIKGRLIVTSPNGGEIWRVGETKGITWTAYGGITNVKLEYSTDADSSFPNLIVSSTDASTGSYSWVIPDAIGNQLRVRITDASDYTVFDTSDTNFEIKGLLTLISPNGDEVWVVGTSQEIIWTKTGAISTVRLEYSRNAFADEFQTKVIADSVDATGIPPGSYEYAWTIPDAISSNLRVRIIDSADTSVKDISDRDFKIIGNLSLITPNGGESWGVGTKQNITWTKIGSIANLRLDYSTDAGASFPNLIAASVPAGALKFTWTIPDEVSDTVKIRIADTSDITVYDISDDNFTIQARFDITSPDRGEVWMVGSTHDITWNTIGTISAVRLDYSTDGGRSFVDNITTAISNTGSFSWTVPDEISSQARVKVSDYQNPNAFGVSQGNFKIRGNISVTSPDGREVWVVGTPHNITWSIVGSIANLGLEYSTNGGLTFAYTIASSVDAAVGSYSWIIPDTLSKTCRVKISDASDATVYDTSDNNFKIRGDLTLISPDGQEQWEVGSIQNINWIRTGSIQNVRIEYSTDGGLSFPNTVIDSLDVSTGAANYSWVVDDAISNQVRVRVSDSSDATVYDMSNADFKIKGVLDISAPNGGEVWQVASTHNITWRFTGSIAIVKLEYSTDGGLTYPYTIIPSVDTGLRTYSWIIPDVISALVRVRITDFSDSTTYDASDSDFKIIGKLALSTPNGGEVWPVGSSQAITWLRVGSIDNVRLEYSEDAGLTYPYLIVDSVAASRGSYSWVVPDSISPTVKVKITDSSDSVVYDTSDSNFKIRGGLILGAPNGGEVWMIGSSQDITWIRSGSIANLRLGYSIDGGRSYAYTIIDSVDASLERHSWIVPDKSSLQARVRISDAADITVYDTSDENFIIRAGFELTAPVGGQAWAVGSTHNITWNTLGSITNVKLEYSTDNGSHWNIIAGSASNTGVYPWVIPDTISEECLVKISDVNDPEAFDTSDSVFKIHGLLTLTSPNVGEVWMCGSTQDITWTKTGSIANVRLQYSTDGGLSYPYLIADFVTADSLSYAWRIPDAVSNQVKLKISDSDDLTVFDASDGVFKIQGAFDLIVPNAGETLIVGDSENIIWDTQGTINNVRLEYSTDAGASWVLIADSVANVGTYSWLVPDSISTLCRVRVSDVNDPEATDTSDDNFKIKGDLNITAPNAGENWIMGTTQTITWDRAGSIANVRLEYSDDGGLTFIPIVESTPNTGSYAWIIPDTITTQAVVRITNVDDSSITDTSDSLFKIQGSLTITSPNGNEAWLVGSRQDITWSWKGEVVFVKLEYSTDSSSTYALIEDSLTNNGTYTWQVPDSVAGTLRVKVSDANDPETFDISDADFRIRCTLSLISPNGGEDWRVGRDYQITWRSIGSIPNVKLQCSRDNFLTDIKTISDDAPAQEPYSWTIPDMIFDTVKVRVSDPDDAGAYDDSDADFRITGDFTITSPNGGEIWRVGETQGIAWIWQGSIPQVKIEYSTDGGVTYSIVSATDNTGSYAWRVPDEVSTEFKLRISDLVDPTVYDISDANAEIRQVSE